MAWLFLLTYWIVAIVVASLFYAMWNRGVTATTGLATVRHLGEELPERAPEAAYERDAIIVRSLLRSKKGTRGPVRLSLRIGSVDVVFGAGLVSEQGISKDTEVGPTRRGAVDTSGSTTTGDPLGLFRARRSLPERELLLVLPRFASLRAQPVMREQEASITTPRAGHGTEIFGVREYRPGDPLRRIHWRSTARRGELIVREFEPPGVQHFGIFLDPSPANDDAADQVARIAASEAWDCVRTGGRVTLWAPGCEPTRPDEERNFLALLEWLARYPKRAAVDEPPPMVRDAIAVTTNSDARLLDAVEDVRAHGGSARAWVVGEAALESDVEVERAGLNWPL